MKTYLTAHQAKCLDLIIKIALEEGRPSVRKDLEDHAGVKRADWILAKLSEFGLIRRAVPKEHRFGQWWPVRTAGGRAVHIKVTLDDESDS